MDLRGVVADAWEILANIGGNRGHPGSCALKALANVPKVRVVTSLARYWRCGCCVIRGGQCCLGEVTAYVLMTSVDLGTSVADALVDSG